MLPLVNKRWARALRGPSHAWRSVSIGSSYDGVGQTRQDAPKQLDSATVLAWFMNRPGCAYAGTACYVHAMLRAALPRSRASWASQL